MIRERIGIEDYVRISKKRKANLILKNNYNPGDILGKEIQIYLNDGAQVIYRKVKSLKYIDIGDYTAHIDRKTTKGQYIKGKTDKINYKLLKENYKITNMVLIAQLA